MEEYLYSGGQFVNVGNANWQEWQQKQLIFYFKETERDNEWITLYDDSRNIWVELPVGGGKSYYAWGGDSDWTELYEVRIAKVHDMKLPCFADDPILQSVLHGERLLQSGDEGSAVQKIQQALIDAGFPLPKYGADSDFGSETETAVRSYQSAHGLEANGIIGTTTMESLDALFSAPPTTTSEISVHDVIDERIDVAAQKAILRMRSRSPDRAYELLNFIKNDQLRCFVGDDLKVAADLAQELHTFRWELVPKNEDAALVYGQGYEFPPLAIYKEVCRKSTQHMDRVADIVHDLAKNHLTLPLLSPSSKSSVLRAFAATTSNIVLILWQKKEDSSGKLILDSAGFKNLAERAARMLEKFNNKTCVIEGYQTGKELLDILSRNRSEKVKVTVKVTRVHIFGHSAPRGLFGGIDNAGLYNNCVFLDQNDRTRGARKLYDLNYYANRSSALSPNVVFVLHACNTACYVYGDNCKGKKHKREDWDRYGPPIDHTHGINQTNPYPGFAAILEYSLINFLGSNSHPEVWGHNASVNSNITNLWVKHERGTTYTKISIQSHCPHWTHGDRSNGRPHGGCIPQKAFTP